MPTEEQLDRQWESDIEFFGGFGHPKKAQPDWNFTGKPIGYWALNEDGFPVVKPFKKYKLPRIIKKLIKTNQ